MAGADAALKGDGKAGDEAALKGDCATGDEAELGGDCGAEEAAVFVDMGAILPKTCHERVRRTSYSRLHPWDYDRGQSRRSRPCSKAAATAAARSRTPNLAYACSKWVLTVASLR